MTTYENVHSHMQYHSVKKWFASPDVLKPLLLAGAWAEDANTIGEAVERMSEIDLVRRLARSWGCAETPEAIREEIAKTPKDRVIRRLARAITK
jgi:hypothetical protein